MNVHSGPGALAIRDLVKRGADPNSPAIAVALEKIPSDLIPPFELLFPRPLFDVYHGIGL